MTDPLQELLDKRALDELIFRTMHALDARDWNAYRTSFVDEVAFDFREHGAAPPEARQVIEGYDNFIVLQRAVIEGFDTAQHHVTNMVHTLNGDEAVTDCCLYAEHFLNNDFGDRSVSLGGRYQFHSRKGAEGWKIHRQRFYSPWIRGNPMLYQLAVQITSAREATTSGPSE
jgi:3-phenylpropionate/cinnamic acid dioxygenase small subunit